MWDFLIILVVAALVLGWVALVNWVADKAEQISFEDDNKGEEDVVA